MKHHKSDTVTEASGFDAILSGTKQATKHRYAGKRATDSLRNSMQSDIRNFANLLFDFDGNDGHPPSNLDISNACDFIRHIPDGCLPYLVLAVAGDGDITFSWDTPNDVEVGFVHGGFSYCGINRAGKEDGGEFGSYNNEIPKNLKEFMEIAAHEEVKDVRPSR